MGIENETTTNDMRSTYSDTQTSSTSRDKCLSLTRGHVGGSCIAQVTTCGPVRTVPIGIPLYHALRLRQGPLSMTPLARGSTTRRSRTKVDGQASVFASTKSMPLSSPAVIAYLTSRVTRQRTLMRIKKKVGRKRAHPIREYASLRRALLDRGCSFSRPRLNMTPTINIKLSFECHKSNGQV